MKHIQSVLILSVGKRLNLEHKCLNVIKQALVIHWFYVLYIHFKRLPYSKLYWFVWIHALNQHYKTISFVCICFADMHLFHCCVAFVCYLFFCFNVFRKQSMARKWFPIILSICLHYLVGSHWKFTVRDSLIRPLIRTYVDLSNLFIVTCKKIIRH